MNALSRVVVLTHELDDFEGSGYLMPHIVRVWRELGVEVVVHRGLGTPPDADAAVMHVDLTRVPREYAAMCARYPVTINGGALDISKRVVSRDIVSRGDGYDGPVIVKTDRNCGGLKEALLARASGLVRRCVRSVHRRLPWYLRAELGGKAYRVYQSAREVPLAAWYNRALVVEKYLMERHDGFNWLRSWHFFGDRDTMSLRWSTHEIVAVPHLAGTKLIEPDVPEDLRARRRELGFDFGKFDFAIVDGRAVLYDANRTPTNTSLSREALWEQACLLADGLDAMVREVGAGAR